MQRKIDLKQLAELKFQDAHTFEALQHFFNDIASPNVFYGNENTKDSRYRDGLFTYNYDYKGISYEFSFSQTVLRTNRKHDKPGYCFDYFERLSTPTLKGGYGAVYPVLGSISSTSDGDFVSKPGGKKVVKHEQLKNAERQKFVIKEHQGLVKAGHIKKLKTPIFNIDDQHSDSFIVMEKIEGESLEKLLHPTKRSRKLTLKERIELTFAILDAIQEQVVERKLVHRDIKPANIMVDLSSSPPKVRVIDYGFNLDEDEQDHLRCGTRAYRAPESFNYEPIYSTKSDVWAASRVLSYLWGDKYKNYYLAKTLSLEDLLSTMKQATLFSEPELELFLTPRDKEKINAILRSMTANYSFKRISIKEAIEKFKEINFAKYTESANAGFDRKLADKQLAQIDSCLAALEQKANDLHVRGFYSESEEMVRVGAKLVSYTKVVKNESNPFLIKQYQLRCINQIAHSREKVKHRRDLNWILAELSAAILLLGVGYALALGINYHATGRLGLFSQTKSDKLLEQTSLAILSVPT